MKTIIKVMLAVLTGSRACSRSEKRTSLFFSFLIAAFVLSIVPTVQTVAQNKIENPTKVDAHNGDDIPIREISAKLVSGGPFKAYSVICCSFSVRANAWGAVDQWKRKGYEAFVILISDDSRIHVAVSTFDKKSDAIQCRSQLLEMHPDAWILHTK